MEKKNQTTEVLDYMKEHGSITSNEAWSEFGVTRLSAIIFNLRHLGWEITTEDCTCKNRYGNTTNYAKYVLGVQND